MTQDSHGNVLRKHLSPFKLQKLVVGDVSTSDQQNNSIYVSLAKSRSSLTELTG